MHFKSHYETDPFSLLISIVDCSQIRTLVHKMLDFLILNKCEVILATVHLQFSKYNMFINCGLM